MIADAETSFRNSEDIRTARRGIGGRAIAAIIVVIVIIASVAGYAILNLHPAKSGTTTTTSLAVPTTIAVAAPGNTLKYELNLSLIPNSQDYKITNFTYTPASSSSFGIDEYMTRIQNTTPITSTNIPYKIYIIAYVGNITTAASTYRSVNASIQALIKNSPSDEITIVNPNIGTRGSGVIFSPNASIVGIFMLVLNGGNVISVQALEQGGSTSAATVLNITSNFYNQVNNIR